MPISYYSRESASDCVRPKYRYKIVPQSLAFHFCPTVWSKHTFAVLSQFLYVGFAFSWLEEVWSSSGSSVVYGYYNSLICITLEVEDWASAGPKFWAVMLFAHWILSVIISGSVPAWRLYSPVTVAWGAVRSASGSVPFTMVGGGKTLPDRSNLGGYCACAEDILGSFGAKIPVITVVYPPIFVSFTVCLINTWPGQFGNFCRVVSFLKECK